VFFHVRLAGFLAVVGGVVRVTACRMRVMSRLFMVAALVMLGSFLMVVRCLGVMVGGVLVVLSCFRRHCSVYPFGSPHGGH
jgi:hypothetical protein